MAAMKEKTLTEGMRIALDALLWASTNNQRLIAGDGRRAIKVLFGEEVDAALADGFDAIKEKKKGGE